MHSQISIRFLLTFDVDWSSDIPLMLLMMMTVLFYGTQQADGHLVLASVQQKWGDRLKR